MSCVPKFCYNITLYSIKTRFQRILDITPKFKSFTSIRNISSLMPILITDPSDSISPKQWLQNVPPVLYKGFNLGPFTYLLVPLNAGLY